MIREAMEKVQELAIAGDEIRTFEHGGMTFSTRPLTRVPDEKPVPKVASVTVATLRSLAEYINDNPDDVEDGTFVHVVSATRVEVVTPVLGENAERKTFAIAQARLPQLLIGKWVSPEELAVHLRTCFAESPTRDEVVAFLGGIIDKAELKTEDDGVSQSTTVRSGISMVKEGKVPSPVTLAPYRTFYDVPQQPSPFVLRLQKGPQGVTAALFEADGGAWQHFATEAVATHLRGAVKLTVYG